MTSARIFQTLLLLQLFVAGCGTRLPSVFDQPTDTLAALEIHPSTARPVPEIPFTLHISGRWQSHRTAIEPAYPNHITSMVVRGYERSITSSEGWTRLAVDLQVEAMQEGVHYIPPFTIVLYSEAASETVLRTYPLYLDVRFDAAEDVEDIRDIKPLWRAPVHIPWALASLSIVILLALMVTAFLWFKRRSAVHAADAGAQLQQVLDQLGSVARQNLDRDQASQLSLALRAWYEQASGIAVAEMTPREIRACAGTYPMHAAWLIPLATLCDRLAFVQFGTAESSPEPVQAWLDAVTDLPDVTAPDSPEPVA